MNRDSKTGKIFSENLDRLLAGKAVKAGAAADKDMLSALGFAAKIADIKPVISPGFQSRLKASLMAELESRAEPVKKRAWFDNILHQPAWQAAAAVFMVVLIVSIVWRAGVFNITPAPSTTTAITSATTTTMQPTYTTTTTAVPTSTSAVENLLTYSIATDKTIYQPGEQVKISLSLKNISSRTLTLDNLPPILSIMDADTGRPVYTFSAGEDTGILAQGDSVRLSYTWDETDFNGRDVTGSYYIELEDMESQGMTIEFQQPQQVRFRVVSE